MNSFTISSILRENSEEVTQRWLKGLHGQIAEDYEQMLLTPMGSSLGNKLLSLAIDCLAAENIEISDTIHRARNIARDSSYRRACVGFSLNDTVATAISFRKALNDTLTNHFTPSSIDDYRQMVDSLLALNRFCDAIVAGEIAGYFACRDFNDNDSEAVA